MSQTSSKWEVGVAHIAATDIGMRRSNNQDAHTVVMATSAERWRQRGHLFMVADGMGAHAAGELASKLAVDGVPHLYGKYADLSPPEALQRALSETNAEIYNRGRANPDFHNMGTTASALVLLPQGAVAAHVGDSRVYRLREGQLEQLTFDHSLVWEMRAAGQIPEGEAHAIPKNVITRSLGPNERVQVDVEGPLAIKLHDTFLLCSDGLTGQVEDAELGILLSLLPPEQAAAVLIDLANLRGGPDNTTVIVIRVTSPAAATNDKSAPLALGRSARPAGSPALWVAPPVCLLLALVLWMSEIPEMAALLALVGLGALVYAIYKNSRGGRAGVLLSEQHRLGRGPYVQEPLPTDEEAVQRLGDVLRSLRETAAQCHWTLSWEAIDRHCEAAETAGIAPPQAAAEYALAIRCMMKELRSLIDRQASDSAVEL